MEIITLTKKQFDNLEEYPLPAYLFVAESKLYILKTTNKWETNNKLLKNFILLVANLLITNYKLSKH